MYEFQKKFEYERVENVVNKVMEQANYLSKTIDDFRMFIDADETRKTFFIHQTIDKFVNLVRTSLEKDSIQIITNIEKELNIYSFENQLIQCLINIFNNSKDAFIKNKISVHERFIFLDVHILKEELIITIKDNAQGIPSDILDKIFEPYFTTKHQLIGTGLGLHMTYDMVVNQLKGLIKAENIDFSHNNKDYKGANFVISLPLNL